MLPFHSVHHGPYQETHWSLSLFYLDYSRELNQHTDACNKKIDILLKFLNAQSQICCRDRCLRVGKQLLKLLPQSQQLSLIITNKYKVMYLELISKISLEYNKYTSNLRLNDRCCLMYTFNPHLISFKNSYFPYTFIL